MSYYIFERASPIWHNREIKADLQNTIDSRDYQPHWWDAEPLHTSLPPLVYAVPHKAPLLDNYSTRIYDLYSYRLINLIRDAGVYFETFPATLLDRKTDRIISTEYAAFHLLESYTALDKQQSVLPKPELADQIAALDPNDPRVLELYTTMTGVRNLVLTQSW